LELNPMKRPLFALLVLLASLANQGCQSCCAPHDYTPPVSNAECSRYGGGCGNGRAGSILTGGPAGEIHHPMATEEAPAEMDVEQAH
jgi:hypothetical protein